MHDPTPDGIAVILARIQSHTLAGDFRLTDHAVMEMGAEAIRLAEVIEAISHARVIEDYPDHRRGPCCLLGGATSTGRSLHVVCTTSEARLVFITVYEPVPPKFPTPWARRQK